MKKQGNQYFQRQVYASGAIQGSSTNYSSNMTQKLKSQGRQTQAASSSGNSAVNKSRPDMNITAPVLSFSGANLHSSNINVNQLDTQGSPKNQTRTSSSGGVGTLRTSTGVAPNGTSGQNGVIGGRIISQHNKTQLINSSRVGQGQGFGPLGPASSSPQSLGSNFQRIPATRQNGANMTSPKQASSASGMPNQLQQQQVGQLQNQNGKRTIMSGIVRRQPITNGQNGTPEQTTDMNEQYMTQQNQTSGGIQPGQQVQSTLANTVNPQGILNANKISFHPTGPARQSQLQPQQQQPFYHGNRQATTSQGRRGNSTQQNNIPNSQGHTLQSKWARLMHGQSPDQVLDGDQAQMAAAMSMAFSSQNPMVMQNIEPPNLHSGSGGALNSPGARYYPQRPGTQGAIAIGNGSPNSMGSGGAVHDVAARVKKYKQQQYHSNQQQNSSGSAAATSHSGTRNNKAQSQRGLSDLLRNQNAKKMTNQYSKYQRMHSNNSNAGTSGLVGGGMGTLEGRSPTGGTAATSGRFAGFQTEQQPIASSKVMQTQKLQNNFFFQPSSPRDSSDIINLTQAADANSNPNLQNAAGMQQYQQHRNIRTAAGGPRQRMLSQSNAQNKQGFYPQNHHLNLQIQTNNSSPANNAIILAPHHLIMGSNGSKQGIIYPQTTDNMHTAALGKSFDFNKYRKEHGTAQSGQMTTTAKQQQMMHNMVNIPTSAAGGSNQPVTGVHQHPESAFFKPKINPVADRPPIQSTATSHRTNRLGTQRYPHQGTISPKGGTNAQRGSSGADANPAHQANSPTAQQNAQHIWTSKKKANTNATGGTTKETNQQQANTEKDQANNQVQKKNSQPQPQTAADEIVFSEKHSMSDYIIGNKIGQGAYAVVHIGMHRKLNKKVALKIYEKEKIKDIQRKKSVRREIRLMKRLSHPNIAQLYEAIETEDQVVLVLEYVPGGSTHGFLKSKPQRRMAEDDARRIYRQLMNALQYLHSKCIAHRDIKLENVMLDERNQVKLIDFGFSTCIPNEQRIKIFCGTPSYMAPEIVRKTEFCGPPTDIYASGVLLFAFFCGQFPYRGQNDKELYNKIMTGDLTVPEYVPPGPRSIITRCMQVDADARPTSADLWSDPWLQNFNATCDSSLVSYSSRQSYSNRNGSNYLNKTTTSPRYPGQSQPLIQQNQNSSKPFFSPNGRNQKTGTSQGTQRNIGATGNQGRGSNDSGGTSRKNPHTINNNINIINNITQITYHTPGQNQGVAENVNAKKDRGGIVISEGSHSADPNATVQAARAGSKEPAGQLVISQEALDNLVSLGLSHEEIQRHIKEHIAQGGTVVNNF